MLEDQWPAFHTFGVNHDRLVGFLTGAGLPDLLVNVPTMGVVLIASIYQEVGNAIFRGVQVMQVGTTFGPSPFEHTDP